MKWDKLKTIRELLKYSQGDMSDKTGIKQKDISLLEGGKKKFIPNEYIHFLYNENVDINSIYDDNLPIRFRKNDYSPKPTDEIEAFRDANITYTVHPTNTKVVHPSVHATHNFGLPKVITVTENDRELITLVPFKAAAGYLDSYNDPAYIENLPTIRMPNLSGGTHRAFEIKGNSMLPTLQNKSIVIGRWVESFDEIVDRRIYIIITNEYKIVAKRVLNRVSERGVLVMMSDNNNKIEYGNYDVEVEDIKEIWYVRASISFEFTEPDHSTQNRLDDIESQFNMLQHKIKHLLK
ncbi:hypothetical protein FM120_11255 [Sphingobacterium faecium PCAi_F2.5]|nr:hypothetical protein FM120_11255 [Sphingobacterium faecium PCAi_F2.5]